MYHLKYHGVAVDASSRDRTSFMRNHPAISATDTSSVGSHASEHEHGAHAHSRIASGHADHGHAHDDQRHESHGHGDHSPGHGDHDDQRHDDHSSGHGHGHGHGDHDDHDDHDHGHGALAKLKHIFVPHSHDANDAIQSAQESSGQGIRAAWIGLAGMMTTAILQIFIVAISGSIALLADTLHNLGHAMTTIPLVIAFRIGQRAASKRYSYGYRRAEDLVGVLISLVIAASAALIIYESIDALINPRPLSNLGWVFAAGLVGALGNEVVAVYRIRTGRKIGSAALIAEGQHARADGLTSIAVVVGVVGVWFGFARLDAIIGLFIAAAILWILFNSMRTICRRLMDGVDPGVIESMTTTVAAVDGVVDVDRVRARWSGHRMEADANVVVAKGLSVVDGHHIAEQVQHQLLHTTPHLEEVVVHLHPDLSAGELDELHELSGHHASAEARNRYLAKTRR
ncbi:cation diffusion facilitator family transporter [Rhodococcus jostii]|uniref:Cation diffusion facilitator family transporter n=1 Tax=Rhodococcus jostii TaxID=132919 RepID=A0A1H4IQU1_RHOJO|nr:cation diffusion facilitator family transporter [Rhodococcus jostii]